MISSSIRCGPIFLFYQSPQEIFRFEFPECSYHEICILQRHSAQCDKKLIASQDAKSTSRCSCRAVRTGFVLEPYIAALEAACTLPPCFSLGRRIITWAPSQAIGDSILSPLPGGSEPTPVESLNLLPSLPLRVSCEGPRPKN